MAFFSILLAPPGESMGYAAWSRDGRWIAGELRRNDETYLAVIPGSGGAIEQLNSEPAHSWVHSWPPGDDKPAFARASGTCTGSRGRSGASSA
jgi:Tol biopolymer transport system component